MTKTLSELLTAYRIAKAIPEYRPLDKEEMAEFMGVIKDLVIKIEGIWPNKHE